MKYRSIDTDWEDDEVIVFGNPDNAKETITYILRLNGSKPKKLICHFEALGPHLFDDTFDYVGFFEFNSASAYFRSINFTGEYSLIANSRYYEVFHKVVDGRLHCLDGPALYYRTIHSLENTDYGLEDEYAFYKNGKPWYCLVVEGLKKHWLKVC